MTCPTTKRTTTQPATRRVAATQKGSQPAAKVLTRQKRVTRKQLEEACDKLGVLTLREVMIRLADLKGYVKPFSRQSVYNLIARKELAQGINLAGMATITRASWDGYVVRYESGLAK